VGGCNNLGAKVANAAFATRPQAAAPVARAEPVSARPRNSSGAQTSDFNSDLQAERSDSVNAVLKLNQNQSTQPPAGSGLLSTGVQFLLAETRTQEAGAPLPPVSNFARARDQYLSTQAQVRDTIAANQFLRQDQAAAEPAPADAEPPAPQAAVSAPGLDEDFDAETETQRQFAVQALRQSLL